LHGAEGEDERGGGAKSAGSGRRAHGRRLLGSPAPRLLTS
jgi:hypothetical protein